MSETFLYSEDISHYITDIGKKVKSEYKSGIGEISLFAASD